MPVSPDLAVGLAQTTVDLYAQAEAILLARIARQLGSGMESPTWAEDKLLGIQLLRGQLEVLLARLADEGAVAIGEAILQAYNRGGASAVRDLAEAFGGPLAGYAEPLRVPGQAAVQVLVAETVTKVQATHLRVLRSTFDVYRQVIAETSAQVLLGTQTRREAAQTTLDRLTARGVTGFVDRTGRPWDLASYVEMAVRASGAHAAVQAHVDRLQAYGHDLVIVSDAPQECVRCRPWEGKVLSLSGQTIGAVGEQGRQHVEGTLAQATAAGLFHPNCRHSTALYQPGITPRYGRTEDPEGDADRQRLRLLERRLRAAKRTQAVALDDGAARKAGARVRDLQAQIRAHTATTTAKRQPARERIGVAR